MVNEIAKHYKEIMKLLGVKQTVDNQKTPERVAKMLADLFQNDGKDPFLDLADIMTVFPNKLNTKEFVEVSDIPFHSMCSHHHMPFFGKATVRYIPDKSIIGLSKIPRAIKWFSRKPQVQENLTNEIGEFLTTVLNPIHLEVIMYDATHTCMTCRGIESPGKTTTKYMYKRY